MISSVISEIPSRPIGTIKKLTTHYSGLSRALALVTAYAIWISLFKLFCMTVVTYLVVSSSAGHGARFEEINDAYSSVELLVLGAGSLAFTFGVGKLYPRPPLSRDQLFRRSLPGVIHGTLISLGLALIFLFRGGYRYLGSLLLYDERPILALFGLTVKAASILALVVGEEIIFRRRILDLLLRPAPREPGFEAPARADFQPRIAPVPDSGPPPPGHSPSRAIGAILLSGVVYAAVKYLQFGMGWTQCITLFLVSIYLGLKAETEEDLAGGTAFWASLLIFTHVVLGLPIFGNDSSSGLILLKGPAAGRASEAIRLLTGGRGGPIASLSLQLLLSLEILRDIFRESGFKLYIFNYTKRGS